ncbi:fimbrial biogenesis chaperone [Roseospirillum parvum]|uniref:Pili and flagellar-assembly chaperone, PapD N-terminal domain n=1 Tax=Roseospirillum parvum TaxID=83401 RepID=A0A1G8FAW2_9PROT|nr:fimbria/pilus periplasmic chaperone [Roseospirillum parvum]SDH79270.1 Pili and flagellar-assembly chaperone, PapD N-terminal domain [Roseospirillum parvum]
MPFRRSPAAPAGSLVATAVALAPLRPRRRRLGAVLLLAGLLVLAALVAASLRPAAAQGNLSISPTRLVFEGRSRTAEAIVVNRGDAPAEYRVLLKEMRMSEDGDLVDLAPEEVPDHSAAAMIRYSPRSVTLGPGESQTIRLALRRSRDMADGEYRSHLLVQNVPPPDTGETVEQATGAEEGALTIRLTAIFGMSIPVIVRQGELSLGGAISQAGLLPPDPERADDPRPRLGLTIERQGARSLYADVEVYHQPPGGGEEVQVGLVRGLGVYVEIPHRATTLTLNPPEGTDLSAGSLRVVLRSNEEDGTGEVLDETTVPLS